jgi:hypothetical protein
MHASFSILPRPSNASSSRSQPMWTCRRFVTTRRMAMSVANSTTLFWPPESPSNGRCHAVDVDDRRDLGLLLPGGLRLDLALEAEGDVLHVRDAHEHVVRLVGDLDQDLVEDLVQVAPGQRAKSRASASSDFLPSRTCRCGRTRPPRRPFRSLSALLLVRALGAVLRLDADSAMLGGLVRRDHTFCSSWSTAGRIDLERSGRSSARLLQDSRCAALRAGLRGRDHRAPVASLAAYFASACSRAPAAFGRARPRAAARPGTSPGASARSSGSA